MREKLFRFLAFLCYTYPRALSIILILSGVLSAIAVVHLHLQTELEDLLPASSPVVQNYFKVLEKFGLADYLIVFFDAAEPINMDAIPPVADALAEAIKSLPTVAAVDYKFMAQEYEQFSSLYLQALPLFLDEDKLAELTARLTSEGMLQQLQKDRRLLSSEASVELQRLIAEDPLALLIDFTALATGQSGRFNLTLTDGYYLSQDGTKLFMLVKTRQPPQNVAFDRALNRQLSTAISGVQARFGDGELRGVRLRYSGAHIIVVNESGIIRGDIISTAVSSFVGVLLLFLVAYRRPGAMFYVGVPLAIGILWMLAAGYLVIGYLNLLTSICSAVTMGLGIDFAIHIYSCYQTARAEGKNPKEATEESIVTIANAMTTAGITTALAFYAMMLTDFQGIVQFGFMTGTGIMSCLLVMCTLMPALLVWRDRSRWKPFRYQPIRDFGFSRLTGFVARRYRGILAAAGAATLISVALIPRVRFNDDLQSIRSSNNPALKTQMEVQGLLGSALKPFVVLLRSDTEANLLQTMEEALKDLQASEVKDEIVWSDSLQRYLPPYSQQLKALAWLQANRQQFAVAGLSDRFKTAIDVAGLRYLDKYDDYLGNITTGIERRTPIELQSLEQGLLQLLLHRYVVHDGDGYHAAIYIYAKHKLTSSKATRAFVDALERSLAALPSHCLTGMNLLTLELKERIHSSFYKITILVSVGVVLLVFMNFRSVSRSALALLPLVLSVLWMIGLMAVFKIDFNYINIAVSPMILGIGIDYQVYILCRYYANGKNAMQALQTTGLAILMTALTTIVGFGSCAFAAYKGIASMGILTTFGVSLSLINALMVLPAVLIALSKPATTAAKGQSHSEA